MASSIPRPAVAARARFAADEITARVIWYYYVGNLTQQEIADRLALTRLRVNKIIGQARLDGSVRIDVRLPLASCVAIEEEIAGRYGLADAAVVPAVPDYHDQQRVIGEAAGAMLSRLIADGRSIGVGWGRTLGASVASLEPRKLADSRVVSLMGGLTRGSGTNTFEVATRFAEVFGGECHYLAAPIYCPSEDSRADLLTHYGLADVMRRARDVHVALVSCGDVSNHSLLASTLTVREEKDALEKAGAIGDLLGTFLDARGRPVDHRLNHCVMALAPHELKAAPVSILASGGLNKAPIVHAILTAGYVNRLVTDEDCARAVLAMGAP